MTKILASLYLLFAVIIVFSQVLLASAPGTTSTQILRIGIDARSAALGDSYVSVAEGVGAIFWNPAGIARTGKKELGFSYVDLFSEVTLTNISYIHPLSNERMIGISYSSLDSGEITRTMASSRGLYVGDEGTFKAQNSVLTFSIAGSNSESSYYGVNLKSISERIDDSSSTGFTFDIGLLYTYLRNRLTLGVSILNIFGGTTLGKESFSVPTNLLVGSGYKYRDLLISVDVSKISDRDIIFHAGMEYLLAQMLALRIGYNGQTDAKFTMGFGLIIKTLSFDYSMAQSEYLGYIQKLTLSIQFGENIAKQWKANKRFDKNSNWYLK